MSLDLHPVESPDEEINKKIQASNDYANSSKREPLTRWVDRAMLR